MQAWDQVKVTGGEYTGRAGVVQAVNPDAKTSTVKLDETVDADGAVVVSVDAEIDDSNLLFLGR